MDNKTVTIDAREFFARINLADKVVRGGAFKGVRECRLDLERKGGELIPVDDGILLGSVGGDTVDKGHVISAEVSYNTPYAAAVHERMIPAPAPSFGTQMHPGPKTRAKPGNEFGPAGGHYLRRPLIGKANQYWQHIAKTIQRALDAKGKI